MSLFLTTTKHTFEGKRSDETVISLLRRHSFLLILTILGFSMLALVPFSLLFYYYGYLKTSNLTGLAWFGSFFFFSIAWHALFYRIMDYLLDTWIITDQRIIDSQQLGFFHRRVVETEMDRIQDVATEISSVASTFLNFGNVEVQTAGSAEKIFLDRVPNPNEVKDTIMDISRKLHAQHPETAKGSL